MSDSSNICLPCGICCDGTLIGFVELENEEMPRLKKIMDIEEERDHCFFLQPCKKYCNGCTIYSERPKQCGKFECGLLKSVENKELEFDTALDIIAKAKQLRVSIEKKLEDLDKNSIASIVKNSEDKMNNTNIGDKEKYFLSHKIDTLKQIS